MPEEKVPSEVPAVVPPIAEPPKVEPPKVEMVDKAKYDAAVREMNFKQQRAALLEKELELERKSKVLPAQPDNRNQEPPEHVKRQLEAQFNMPYGHINLMDRMLAVKNKEISEVKAQLEDLSNTIYEGRYENTKDRLKNEDPIFDEFMPEIEAKLSMLPVKQRTNKEELAKIKAEVVNNNLSRILQLAEERGRQSISAKPPTPPEVNSPSGGGTPPQASSSVTHLTADQKAFIEKSGGNVQAVEEYVSGKAKPKSGWGKYAE